MKLRAFLKRFVIYAGGRVSEKLAPFLAVWSVTKFSLKDFFTGNLFYVTIAYHNSQPIKILSL